MNDSSSSRFRIRKLEDRIAPTASGGFLTADGMGGAVQMEATVEVDHSAEDYKGNHVGENNTATTRTGWAGNAQTGTGD